MKKTVLFASLNVMESERVFCPVPWSSIFVSTDGSFMSCIIASSTEDKGAVTGEDGRALSIQTDSIQEARNATVLKELRRNMLAGTETPSVCRRCIDEEANGLISRRELERRKSHFTLEDARRLTSEDGAIAESETPVTTFDLRMGNHCNLSCGTCNPSQSSGWYQEWFETRFRGFRDRGKRYGLQAGPDGKVFLPDSPYLWNRRPEFWDQILTYKDGLREIHFSGGEPLLSAAHAVFLEKIAESGESRQLSLSYNSNLTVVPPRLLDVWTEFRAVRIGVSIDGPGKINDYVRYPSDFATIERNLRLLEALPDSVSYWVTTTLSALNIGHFPKLLRWMLHSDLGKMNRPAKNEPRFLSYHLLRKPELQSALALPAAAKEIVRNRFENFLADEKFLSSLHPIEAERVTQSLKSLLKALFGRDLSHLSPELLRQTKISDGYRGLDFLSLDPEVGSCLETAALTASLSLSL